MRKILNLFILSWLVCSSSFGAYAPVAPTVTVGGMVFTDLTNLKILMARSGGTSPSDNHGGFVDTMNSGVAYVVPAGKSFKMKAYKHMVRSATASCNFVLATATAAATWGQGQPAGFAAFPTDTGGGAAELGGNPTVGYSASEAALFANFPTGKYIIARASSGCDASYLIYGYEE